MTGGAMGARIAAGVVAGLTTLAVVTLGSTGAGAASDTVTNCNGSGPGSLSAVAAAAGPGDTVTFALAPSCATITVADPVDITTDLSIVGPGAGALTVEAASDIDIFDVASGVSAAISGLAIDDGGTGINNKGTVSVTDVTLSDNGSNAGGGIFNKGTLTLTGSTLSGNGIGVGDALGGGGIDNVNGTVTVADSTLTNNSAANGANGGGIENAGGTMTITDSTLSGNNTGDGDGGGIYNDGGKLSLTDSTMNGNSAVDGEGGGIDNDSGTVTVSDSTLVRNTAFYKTAEGGGIYNHGNLTVTNSTFDGNGAKYGGTGGDIANQGNASVAATIVGKSSAGADCLGTVTDGGYNLDTDDSCGFKATSLVNAPSGLDPSGLKDNGGPTETVALESSSAAVGDVSDASLCSTPDQRGVVRPSPCDIGAVQLALVAQAITSPDHATATVGSPLSFTVTTTGTPVPVISKEGTLPKHLAVVNDPGTGTGTISGTPTETGVSHFTLKATFGAGKTKIIVTQAFTLTVDAGT